MLTERELIELTDDEFEEQFKPITEDCSLKFFNPHQIKNTEHQVWTMIEGDEGIYIVNGIHYVNRLEFVMTEVHCDKDKDYQVNWHIIEGDEE